METCAIGIHNPIISKRHCSVQFHVYKTKRAFRKRYEKMFESEMHKDVFGWCNGALYGEKEDDPYVEIYFLDKSVVAGAVAHELFHAGLKVWKYLKSGKFDRGIIIPDDNVDEAPDGRAHETKNIEEQVAYLIQDITQEFWEWYLNEVNTTKD